MVATGTGWRKLVVARTISRLIRIVLIVSVTTLFVGCSSQRLRSPSPQVIAFVAPWCPHCRDLERYFRANNIPYQRMDIAANPRAKRMLDSMGRDSVPTIIVNETVIRGFDQERLNALLFE